MKLNKIVEKPVISFLIACGEKLKSESSQNRHCGDFEGLYPPPPPISSKPLLTGVPEPFKKHLTHFCFIGIFTLSLILLISCGGAGSSNLSDGYDFSNGSASDPIQIRGCFALALFEGSVAVSVDLLEKTKRNTLLLTQSAFLETFTENIRSASNLNEAFNALESRGVNII